MSSAHSSNANWLIVHLSCLEESNILRAQGFPLLFTYLPVNTKGACRKKEKIKIYKQMYALFKLQTGSNK